MGPDHYMICAFCDYRVYDAYIFDAQGPDDLIPPFRENCVLRDWCWDNLDSAREDEGNVPGDENHWWSRRRINLDYYQDVLEECFPNLKPVEDCLKEFLAEW